MYKQSFYVCLAHCLLLMACHSGQTDTLFRQISSEQSGIYFSNDINKADSLIALSFEYVFNGSGVALGDFNNDGLSDLFFTGNSNACRLYINQGNLQFSDQTEAAGINTQGKWASGVALVDINQDGWQDIYICVGGLAEDRQKRANLLYLNQQDGTFQEVAQDYGLADTGYSINAAFLDYDRDGDLDLYVLSTALDPYSWTEFRPRRLQGEASNTDRLYRNNGDNTFTNVSTEAGILIEGYGLGLGLCDLNEDGWTDIYVANDFLSNDVIYINNGDGTFSDQIDQYLDHTSRNSMGTDLSDFNNDGFMDIMVLDMLPTSNHRQKTMFGFFNYDKFKLGIESGYQPQYARNTLQMNNGNGSFSEIAQLAGVDKTDWSWTAFFADFDNDGWQDLFVTNGYRQDITNMDFATYSRQLNSSPIGTEKAKVRQMMAKLKELPEIKLPNYIFKNTGEFPFQNKTKDWGFDHASYSNGAAFADLDNDGDLDLVVNNIDEKAFLYQNTLNDQTTTANHYLRLQLKGLSPNTQAIGAKVKLSLGDQQQHRYVSPYRGYLSTVESTLHFGLGAATQVDQIEITWPDGKVQLLNNVGVDQQLEVSYGATAPKLEKEKDLAPLFAEVSRAKGIDFLHRERDFVDFKIQPILPHKHSQAGPGIAVGDVNGDELEDFFVGGSAGYQGTFFLQNADQTFRAQTLGQDSVFEDMGCLLLDVDLDNDLDLYVVSGGSSFQNQLEKYQDRLYLNDGAGNFSRAQNALPVIEASGASVTATDYDQDGDLDLLVAGRIVPGAYPNPARTYLLRNEHNGGGNAIRFTDVTQTIAPDLEKPGLVCSALWTDFDNDNWTDLIVAGEWMPLTFLKNKEGQFENVSAKTGLDHSEGWWNSLIAADFDQDGDMDYVAGNLGLNSRYQASPKEPVRIYAKDYDRNGRVDPVLCHYIEGKNYLAHSRDMLIKQINSMRVRFKTYAEYGNTVFGRSFTKDELSDAYVLQGKNFASSYIENLGNGQFAMRALSSAAQVAPIFGMLAKDVDGDGNTDLMMVGNSYSTEIMVGQYDACKGVVLKGNGKGDFANIPLRQSGFFVDRDAKALAEIHLGNGQSMYIASRNGDQLKAFVATQNKNTTKVKLSTKDRFAFLKSADGRAWKTEFYYGSSYLSQSTRTWTVPTNVTYQINGQ
ncbi:MAG: VCBS repeat-containing protein [Bacteroidota bacterium]